MLPLRCVGSRHIPFWLLAASCLAFVSCDEQAEVQLETGYSPIVGGQLESGWAGVGALTAVVPGLGYSGSFCTGTLIHPRWVLTAAHCLTPTPELDIKPKITSFFVGQNANPLFLGTLPLKGKFFQADLFVVHPKYSPVFNFNDIALMRLAEPATNVSPLSLSNFPFNKSMQGKEVLYVGYGVSDGVKQSGGGVKRSGYMSILTYDQTTYLSKPAGAAVCFGDSGGPGIFNFAGNWMVIGVNSSVVSTSGNPCAGASLHTRVDPYIPWIEETVQQKTHSCQSDPSVCWCPQACGEDGLCHNNVCRRWTCGQVWNCYSSCPIDDEDCREGCYFRLSPGAVNDFHNITWCAIQRCGDKTDNIVACAEMYCGEYIDACNDTPHGSWTCEEVQRCIANCNIDDSKCAEKCFLSGSKEAQEQSFALSMCFELACGQTPELTFHDGCGWQECTLYLETCFPASGCSILGGDCPPGEACWYSPTGKTTCFPSDGLGEFELCPLVPLDTRPCVDGLQCVEWGSSTVCMKTCAVSSQCGKGYECRKDVEVLGMPSYGVCVCRDDDGDGFCAIDECDDRHADSNPEADEQCGDGRDNNCNGQIDEGCPAANSGAYGDRDNPDSENRLASGGCYAFPVAPAGLWVVLLLPLLTIPILRRSRLYRSVRGNWHHRDPL